MWPMKYISKEVHAWYCYKKTYLPFKHVGCELFTKIRFYHNSFIITTGFLCLSDIFTAWSDPLVVDAV
jgi:hypothetical protein